MLVRELGHVSSVTTRGSSFPWESRPFRIRTSGKRSRVLGTRRRGLGRLREVWSLGGGASSVVGRVSGVGMTEGVLGGLLPTAGVPDKRTVEKQPQKSRVCASLRQPRLLRYCKDVDGGVRRLAPVGCWN